MSNEKSFEAGHLNLLTIAFIVLKLTGYIKWSWWWVLAPTWIPFALVALLFLIALLIWLAAVLLGR